MWTSLLSVRLTFRAVVTMIILSCLSGCGNGKGAALPTVSPDDEERVFLLVAEPSSEGHYADAIAISDSLLANCAMGDTLRAYIMIERIVALANIGNLEASQAYSDTLISFGRKAGISEAVMHGEQAKGVAFRRREMYDSTMACYTRGLDVAKAAENLEMEQCFADLLAILYTEIGRNDEALGFAERSRELAEEIADTTALLSAVSTIGSVHTREKRYSEAISTLLPYSATAAEAAPAYRIKYLTPLFQSYLALDSITRAKEILGMMEEVSAFIPARHQASAVILSAQASLSGREGRYADQWRIYEQIDSLGNFGKTPENILVERALCLAGMGNYKGAYEKMEAAYAALDSVRHVDIEQSLSDFSVRYDTLNKEIEIERLSRQHWILVSVAMLCLMLLGIVVLAAVSARRRHLQRAAQEKQQEYIRGLEQERARMARELHDDVAGELVGLQYQLAELSPEAGAGRVGEIAGKVRRLSHELMPPQFSSQPLTALLLDYVSTFNRQHCSPRLTITDEGSFDWMSLSPEQSYELYRIVQEGVNNALKHSKASAVAITLDGSDRFILSVSNDGATPDTETDSNGIGARTLRARASIIGARAETSLSGQTFTLTIRQS